MSRGKWQQYGLRSIAIYKTLHALFDISVKQAGSVYLASDETELTLTRELHDINLEEGYSSVLLSAEQCLRQYPGLKKSYCRGGLFFPEEITVEPDRMIHRLILYLQEQLGVDYRPGTPVMQCEPAGNYCSVTDTFGNNYRGDKVVICNGRDFRLLFPTVFYQSDIKVSKLQMMKTLPQPGYHLPGSILTGLSIRRYESFSECPSYTKLNAADIDDSCKKWGIHILFKQADDGGIIIGDSHEYATAEKQDELGFQVNEGINALIISEAKRIFDLPHWHLASTWNGFYSQSSMHDVFDKEVAPGIRVVTAIGGKGMTGSAGYSEASIDKMFS